MFLIYAAVLALIIMLLRYSWKMYKRDFNAEISRKLAACFNLSYDGTVKHPGYGLKGEYRGYAADLSVRKLSEICEVSFSVSFSNPVLKGILITKSGVMDYQMQSNGYIHLVTGAADFDSRFFTEYDTEHLALSFMNVRMRNVFSWLHGKCAGLTLDGSGMKATLYMKEGNIADELKRILQVVSEVADGLDVFTDVRTSLLHNLESEVLPASKLCIIYCLMKKFSEDRNDPKLAAEIIEFHRGRYFFKFDITPASREIRYRAFKIIEYTGNEIFQDMLLDELKSSDENASFAVLIALAAVGNVNAVEPIRRLASGSYNPQFKLKCSETVSSIQARSGITEKGLVSLTDPGEMDGALSNGNAVRDGALSMADGSAVK